MRVGVESHNDRIALNGATGYIFRNIEYSTDSLHLVRLMDHQIRISSNGLFSSSGYTEGALKWIYFMDLLSNS